MSGLAKDQMGGPIGVFDSGYGGLTVLEPLLQKLPQYDYIYLGDNARAPYGNRSFELVYRFTREAVHFLVQQGCRLIILACNTASAKALRTIQQVDLPLMDPGLRVLGVLRPTVEALGAITLTRHVGLVGTPGTISSGSYQIEIHKLYPDIMLTAEACPMWVPLVENGELDSEGAAYFVRRHVHHVFQTDSFIDTLLLGCTHYPLLLPLIQRYVPEGVRIISQGQYVADSLTDYLRRHPEMEACCTRGGTCRFLTTESEAKFKESAALFIKQPVEAQQIQLGL